MAKPSFTIAALQPADVPRVARIGADSFQGDRHTEMKALGREPYDHEATMCEIVPGFLRHPRLVCLKAVDDMSGDIMGYCIWGFRGFGPDEMPHVTGRTQPNELPATRANEDLPQLDDLSTDDPIKRLNAITDAHMAAWVEEVMPPDVRCLYVVMLSVSPNHQGRGVGSSLLQWGLDYCHEHDVFAWVHSSEPAHGVYAKMGFETVRSLAINLDEYAPCSPPNEGPDARWGHYAFRYMKYMPRKGQSA